ncbi:hypothetical protein RD792_003334 [Penstemon davidsonii]|uniref:Bifunctional inhibitor/plant lipid transfer protein/seed storage helical domain-containing protein n=1 Tax=Penstemon davidsonii TaxID=160366 RepID=A0ABR0DUL9_9LAMI|nr:hypothetical protein RD792_003334 [Penstemon davidsonii]
MASKMSYIILFLLIVVILWDGATAQLGCTRALAGLSPCFNYVTGNSSTPSQSCCSQLSSVVESQPQCLCTLLKGGSSNFGLAVNQTLALALPGACNVQTPPVSQCSITTPSAPTPTSSPDDETPPEVPSTPSEQDIPAGTGRTDDGVVGGSNIRAEFSFVCTLLLMALSFAFYGSG